MTRRARSRGAWLQGVRAVCVLACAWVLFVVTSCNGRLEFKGSSESEGGESSESSGGKGHGFGGFFQGGRGGSSGSLGNARGGAFANSGGAVATGECSKRCKDANLTCRQDDPDDCVECVRDKDCKDEARSYCGKENPIKNRCVECLDEDDCDPGKTCAWDTHSCVPECNLDSACTSGAQACAEGWGYCMGCLDDDECQGEGECADDYSRCVECDADGDCGGLHCDPVSFTCVECSTSTHCPGSVCNPVTHTCVK